MVDRRILLVTPVSPWDPSNSGAQQRSALLFEALRRVAPTDVLVLREGHADAATPGQHPHELAQLTWREPRLAVRKYTPNAWVNRWCESQIDWTRYGLAVGRYVTPMTKIRWPRQLPTIVDCDDSVYRYPPSDAAPWSRLIAAIRGQLRLAQSRQAVKRYDHLLFCSRRDLRVYNAPHASLLPNVVDEPAGSSDRRSDHRPRTLLIVGSMWYKPNEHGVEWFLEHCWPAIASALPEVTLRIAGMGPPELLRRWERHVRTEAPGFVPDIADEYRRALVAVAPIHHGGGSVVKFLEAAAFGVPCVTTDHVFDAYRENFREAESALVARSPDEMVRHCLALAADPGLRTRLAAGALETLRRFYTVAAFQAAVEAVIRPYLTRQPAESPEFAGVVGG